jgi:hypothetical protein
MTVVWLIGRAEPSDAAPIVAELACSLPRAETHRFGTPGDATRSRAPAPDLVVVVQHRPAEFSRRDAADLLGSQPLARFVVALGPWCASHGRSERLWPEAVTVWLPNAPSRLRGEAERLLASDPPLPLTAGREELILSDPEAFSECAGEIWRAND